MFVRCRIDGDWVLFKALQPYKFIGSKLLWHKQSIHVKGCHKVHI